MANKLITMKARDAHLIKEALAVLDKAPPITLTLDAIVAWTLLGNIQLALRHPQNNGPSADFARQVAEGIISRFPPELQDLARRGFDPRFDI